MTRILIATIGLAAFVGAAASVSAQTPPAQPPGTNVSAPAFVDANGDGICDRFQAGGAGNRAGNGARKGPGNGTGNRGIGPRDGTGNGAGRGTGTGICDGTGPKGTRRGGRR